MTTGSDVQDLRTFAATACGSGLVGSYWARSWSGDDNPSIGVRSSPLVHDPQNGVYASPRWSRPPKRSRANGEHAYTMNLIARFDGVGVWTDSSSSVPATIQQCFGPASFDLSSWTANDDLALIGKLRDAVIGSDFNPAITLGEGKRALETIANAANALAGTIYHAKRGNWSAAGKSLASYRRSNVGRPGKALNNAAQNNLNVQYGIKPILNDVYNAAITVAHLTSVPLQDAITVTHTRYGVVNSSAPSVLKFSGWCRRSKKIKYIRREVDVIKLIGLTDPAQVAWELVPYSFVVDWFIPIGEFLKARGVANSLTGTFVTTVVDKGYANNPVLIYSDPLKNLSGDITRYYLRFVTMNRSVSTSLAVPTPTIKPLSDWATWRHARDAVSLLVTGVHRNRKLFGGPDTE